MKPRIPSKPSADEIAESNRLALYQAAYAAFHDAQIALIEEFGRLAMLSRNETLLHSIVEEVEEEMRKAMGR